MNINTDNQGAQDQPNLRKLKRLLGMAESLRSELERCTLTGNDNDLGAVAVPQTKAIIDHTIDLTDDDFLEVIAPKVPPDASDETKTRAAQLSLAQYIGYAKSLIAEYEQTTESGATAGNIKDSVNRAVDGIERGFESLSKTFGGDEWKNFATSFRDAMENAFGSKFSSRPKQPKQPETPQEPGDAEFTDARTDEGEDAERKQA